MSLIGNMSMDMKRCSRCVLPEVFHNITFDNEGVCSVCHEWDKQWKGLDSKKLESKFNELLLNILKNKDRYDCILAFSGGKDSMYALYLLKRIYNINPLAVNLNNYFQTENVKEWISFVLKKLEVDLITKSPKKDNFFYATKKSFEKTGNFCIMCNLGIYSLCQRVALEYDIDTIFMGGGRRLEGTVISSHPELDFYNYAKMILKDDSVDWNDFKIDTKLCEKINFIFMGDYIKWQHKEIIQTLENEFDIKFSNIGTEYIHADCKVSPIQSYVYYKKNKFTKNENTLANLVRDGQLRREEALVLLKEEVEMLEKEPSFLGDFLKIININRSNFENILKQKIFYNPPWYHGEQRK